jgi:hypothetical protein
MPRPSQSAQRLPVQGMQVVQQPTPHRVGQGFEDVIHAHGVLYATF